MCIPGLLKGGGGNQTFLTIFIDLSLTANAGTWKKCFAYLFHKSTDTILIFKSFTYKSGDAKTKFLPLYHSIKIHHSQVVSVNVD